MTAHVVVGVDGSPASDHAVDWAATEAQLRRRPLRILHAYGAPALDLPLGPDGYLLATGGHTPEQVVAAAAARAAAAAPDVEVSTALAPDAPSTVLIGASHAAAVVVLGSRGLGGFTGLLLGSVSAQVAAHAHSPVVIVRAPTAANGPVLVGVDGSPASAAVLGYAFEQAAWRGVGLTVVHAWLWPTSAGPGDMRPLVYDAGNLHAEERRAMAEALAGWRDTYPDVPVEQRLLRGRPGEVLVNQSADAALTVVGSRGRGGFTGLLLGSVSQQLIHHAHSPVAVVPVK